MEVKPKKPLALPLGGRLHYFRLEALQAIEFELERRIDDVVEHDADPLNFFRDLVREAYLVKTAEGFYKDDEESVGFLYSDDYDELLRAIFETPDPEQNLADFIAQITPTIDSTYNIFEDKDNNVYP